MLLYYNHDICKQLYFIVSIDTTKDNITIKQRKLQIYKLQIHDPALMDHGIDEKGHCHIPNILRDVDYQVTGTLFYSPFQTSSNPATILACSTHRKGKIQALMVSAASCCKNHTVHILH